MSKELKNLLFISRLEKSDSGRGVDENVVARALAYDIDKSCDKDKRAVVERCYATKHYSKETNEWGEKYCLNLFNCEETAGFLGVRKRDLTLAESFNSTMQRIKGVLKDDDTKSLLVIPRDIEFLEAYLRETATCLDIKISQSELPKLEYWQAWNLNIETGLVSVVGYTPKEIVSRTQYVDGDGHAACYHREFVTDKDTKREVCLKEQYVKDPYGMDEDQY